MKRETAMTWLQEYVSDEGHIRHALSVEAVMRYFAEKFDEDPQMWGIVGLIHDLDFDLYPEEHCIKVQEILTDKGCDPVIIRAVASHGYGIVCDIKPESKMEKTLYTIDELTGLIAACALMRPSKSVMDLEVKSVKKKFKSPGFAAKIDRDVIRRGAEMLDLDLDTVIEYTIMGMRTVHEEIGL